MRYWIDANYMGNQIATAFPIQKNYLRLVCAPFLSICIRPLLVEIE